MSGLTSSVVLLRRAFTAVDTGCVSDLLKRHAINVKETRKGRNWTFTIENISAWLTVRNTEVERWEFEDYLIDNDLDFHLAPDAFMLVVPARCESIRGKCILIAHDLAETFGGIECGIQAD